MAKQDYLPDTDAGICALLKHVRDTLPTHFAALSITLATPQVTAHLADTLVYDYLCVQQQRLIAASKASTTEKNRARDGDPLDPTRALDLAFPAAPASIPSPVMPGIVKRFRDFVGWLRSLPGYTSSIGEALNIVGQEESGPDLGTLKPVLSLSIAGGRVEVGWGWGGNGAFLDAIELHVDRGTGMGFLAVDSRPGYVDTEVFPAAAAKWKYRAIYRKDDTRVGQWSDLTEITVG